MRVTEFRPDLFAETVTMAFETLRAHKLRSGLTVLGVVIGITAIVGMTSLIRGFDQSLRDSIRALGPDTIFVAKFSGLSLSAGRELTELLRRPNLTPADATAIETLAPSVAAVDLWLGNGGPPTTERIFYKNERTRLIPIWGTTDNWAAVNRAGLEMGRFFTATEVRHRRPVVVLGYGPYEALFPLSDPLGKTVRIGRERYTVVGVLGRRPSLGSFNLGQDEYVVIPHATYQKQFGIRVFRDARGEHRSVLIAAVPRESVPRDQALREVEEVMRIRHGLKADEPNDFDLITQDAALRVWDQVSRATLLGLVVLSSIALLVGGIGVMAIMTISVTERTREIGIRKALGARRREILWQFLMEAVFLTCTGGVLGVLLGSAIGVAVHYLAGFPVSLPWWSFALGLAFSASVGIFFGLFPAFKAARLDPIEAVRYE